MQLSRLFCGFVLQLYVFSISPGPYELERAAAAIASRYHDNDKGYECGNTFFSNLEVDKVLSYGLENIDKGYFNPQKFHGSLYNIFESLEYFTWPIKNRLRVYPTTKNPSTPFRVVFSKKTKEVVDVISRITNNDYIKCIKVDGLRGKSLTSIPEGTNGYKCGTEFFGDQMIQVSVGLAGQKIGQNNRYPAPYVGDLYPKESRYMIWPILYHKRLYQSGDVDISPYFLVIDSQGKFIEMVAKGFQNNYLRCMRSKEAPKAPTSDSYANLFVPPPRNGFRCGHFFFADQNLKNAAEKAKIAASDGQNRRTLTTYNGHPFYQPCWLWPILVNGMYKKGSMGAYRVVLTLDFKVKCAAIVSGEKIEPCERETISGKKIHDTSDYLCNSRVISHNQLLKAATLACENMTSAKRGFYPAIYEGPRFNSNGPYYTYPVFHDRDFKNCPGLHRVVMNFNCEIVGALTTVRVTSKKKLVKCQRLKDDPIPRKVLYNPTEPIQEHRLLN